ncbi:MAG: hypothetical protein ACQEXQ_22125 [Bacillota bacterium]
MKKQLIMCDSIVFLFIGIFLSAATASSQEPKESVTPQKKLSAAEIKEVKDSVNSIYTPFGEYIRISGRISFTSINSSEVAYEEETANAKTKVIILGHGVFTKKEQ